MRKLFRLLAFSVFMLCGIMARADNITIIWVNSAPSGSCTNGQPMQYVISTGALYSCQAGTWGKIPSSSSGSVAWGNITGTLSNQTDLQTALNAKLSTAGGTMTGALLVHAHSAFGEGSLVDNGPTGDPTDPGVFSPDVIALFQENETVPTNGMFLGLTVNPATPTADGVYGLRVDTQTSSSGPAFGASDIIAGLAVNDSYAGTSTGANAFGVLANEINDININSGEVSEADALDFGIYNTGSGTIDLALGAVPGISNTGSGTIGEADSLIVGGYTSTAGTTTTARGVWIQPPELSGAAAITTNIGLDIQEQCGAGITNCMEIDSEGTGRSVFNGALITAASTTGGAGLNLPPGTAPTSPNNGDCWTTSAGLYCRIGGSTVGPYGTGSGSGTVTTVSVATANGVSGTVANQTTTPAITLSLGAITPTSAAPQNLTASEPAYPNASLVLTSTPAYYACTEGATGSDDSLKLQYCIQQAEAINGNTAIIDARGLTGLTGTVDPYDASPISNSGVILMPCGVFVTQVPWVAHDSWTIKGCTPNAGTGVNYAFGGTGTPIGSTLEAGSSWPTTYSTGTVSAGGAGKNETITGSSTVWSTNVVKGEAFVAPAGGHQGTSSWGFVSAVNSNTSLNLYWGQNNGSDVSAGSSYDVYAPVYVAGGGLPAGTNSFPNLFGMGVENMSFDCNDKTGCIPYANWFGQQHTYVDHLNAVNYCTIGFDVETTDSQNSGPYNNILSSPGTCGASTALPFIFATNAGILGAHNLSIDNGATSSTPNVGVEIGGGGISIEGVDAEYNTTGVGINDQATCVPACPYGGANIYSSVNGVRVSDVHGSGTTAVKVVSTNGNPRNTIIENVINGGWTNLLTDAANSCTVTNGGPDNGLGEYILGPGGTPVYSTASACLAPGSFTTVTASGTATLEGKITSPAHRTTQPNSGSNLCGSATLSGTGWTGSSLGPYTHSSGTTALTAASCTALVAGQSYLVTYTQVAGGGGTVTPAFGGLSGSATTSSGTYTQYATATSNAVITFTPTTGFTGSVTLGAVVAQGPKATSCGTPVIVQGSTDYAGKLTTAASGCVLTFQNAYTNAPSCHFETDTAVTGDASQAVTNTSLTVTAVGMTAFDYECIGLNE